MENEKKLIIDDDWKSRVEAEKEAERQKEEQEAAMLDDNSPCPIDVLQVFPLAGGVQLTVIAESLGFAFQLGQQFPDGKIAVVRAQNMLMVVAYLGQGTQEDIIIGINRWGKKIAKEVQQAVGYEEESEEFRSTVQEGLET